MIAEFLNNIIIYPFFMTFVRMSGIFSIAPFFNDKSVSIRHRLSLALVLSIALAPIVSTYIPAIPNGVAALMLVILGEFLIGLLLGISAKLFIAAVSIAGDFMAAIMGLQAASMLDPLSGTNTTALARLLSLIAITVFIVMDLHLYILKAFVDSYDVIGFNKAMDMGEVVQALIQTISKITILGVKLAAPVVVANLLINIALGILNRLVPQIQVFFISMPLTMLTGIFILVLSIASMLILFTEEIEDNLIIFAIEAE